MKRLFVAFAAILAAGAVCLMAAETPKPGAAKPATAGSTYAATPWHAGKSAAQWYIESLDKVVNLTDAQKKSITTIIEARDKATRDFQAQNAEKIKAASVAMMEAYKANNKEAIAKAQKAYTDLNAPMYEAMKRSQQELDNVLTAEQKAKQQDNLSASWIKSLTTPVELTAAQTAQLKAAYRELNKTGGRVSQAKFPDLVNKMLTPQQKETIFKHRAAAYTQSIFTRANLTPEQKAKVDAMVAEMAKEQAAKNTWDWTIYNKLYEKINALLTPQQKESMKVVYPARQPAAGGTPVQPTQPGSPAKPGKPGKPGAPLHPKPAEKPTAAPKPAARVTAKQVPGGGIVIRLGEGAEGKHISGGGMILQLGEGGDGKSGSRVFVIQEGGEGVRVLTGPAQTAERARMRERIKRQHDLAVKAWQTFQKLDGLQDDQKAEAQTLRAQLEQIEAELRETLRPGRPGAALGLPGQPVGVRPERPLLELRTQVEQLRREVDELKATVKKLAGPAKK